MNPDAKCRSCGAPVRWVITRATGKRMPMDPTPVEDGNVFVVGTRDGYPMVEVALSADGVPASEVFRYQSHFVSCPDSSSWRKS